MSNKNQTVEIVKITVKSWRIEDKYECPKCKNKISIKDNKYVCESCNVQIKPVMNF
jgi:competence CoiA-like predicted nuclease